MFAPTAAAQHGAMPTVRSTPRPVTKPLLTALLATLLAGCAGVPPQAPARSPQAGANALERRSLLDPGLQRFITLQTGAPRPASQPWGLRRLTLAALYFHPDLRVAQAGMQLAEADLQTARQWPNPRLQLGLKYDTTAALLAPNPWTVGAAIGLLLVSHAQREAQAAQAEAGVRAARLLLHATSWSVQAQVQRAYVALWSAQRQTALQQHVVDANLELQGRITARAQSGLDSPLAAALAQQEAQTAALQRTRDRGREIAAHAALAATIGVPDAALRAVRIDFTALDFPPPRPDTSRLAPLRAIALQQRDDVRAAWQRVQAAQAALDLALAQRDGGPPAIAPGAQRDQGATKLTATAAIALPLFNQHQGQIAAARARLAQSQAVLQQVQAHVLARIEQAEAALQAAQRETRQADTLHAADLALLQADETARGKGWIGLVQVLRTRLRALAAEQAGLQARAAQWQALAELQTSLQHDLARTGTPTDVASASPSPLSPSEEEIALHLPRPNTP